MANYFIRLADGSIRYIDHARPFILDGIEFFLCHHNEFFRVTEITTGLLVAKATTEEDVIIEVKRVLGKLGVDEIKKRIEEKQKQFGIQKQKIMVAGII